jgi:uncharacterized damage-inducible protein DinB
VKDVIRKILRENKHISDDAPDWVKVFHTLPREGRIAQIETNRKHILKSLPKIVNFFESKLGDDLEKIEITNDEEVRRRTYGNEMYSTNAVLIQFFFNHETKTPARLKKEIINDLRSFFNIDNTYYGTPLDLDFFKATWEKL